MIEAVTTMWPWWDSLERVSKVNSWALGLAAVFGLLAAASVVLSYFTGGRLADLQEKALSAYKTNADLRIASANEEAAKANERAARANERAAKAEEGAAKATEAAEKEKVERLKLEAQVAPRRFTKEQHNAIVVALKPFAKRRVSVTTYTLDAEGAILGGQLIDVLGEAGLTVEDRLASLSPSGAFAMGVHVRGTEQDLIRVLAREFSETGKLAVAIGDGPAFHVGGMMAGEPFPTGMINILVGVKPVK